MHTANKYRLDRLIWNEALHIRLFWKTFWNLLLASRLKYGFQLVFPTQVIQPSPTGSQAVKTTKQVTSLLAGLHGNR